MPERTVKAKKGFTMPHTFVILFIIIAIAVALTWIIPSGEYTRIEDPVSGSTVVDANSFQYVEDVSVNPLKVPMIIVQAFADNGDLITLILLSGGAIYMLTAAGALQALVAVIVRRFSKRVEVFIPLLMLVFALICTTQAVNTFIGFAPITVMLALSLGLDSIVGVGIILMGGAVGFSTGTLQTSTTLLAQDIAGLAPFSGIGFRFLCLLVFYVITNAYLIRYAMKIQKNPQLSPMYELDQQNEMKAAADLDAFGAMTWRRWAILAALVGALAIIVYGGLKMDWDMPHFAAMFLWLAVIVGLLDGKSPSAIAKGLVAGCKTMLGAALIIGLARAIALILTAGGIIDTIVYALAGVLNVVPSFLQAPVMFILNIVINIFITSGSGQAAVVMPLFLPVADLVGMTRQTAILAFNFGDGFCNYVLPTSTALMGLIGAANVPYDKWMKFMWKLFLIWVVTGCILVSIAQAIHLA